MSLGEASLGVCQDVGMVVQLGLEDSFNGNSLCVRGVYWYGFFVMG